jgi:hypothetical protein
MNNWPNDSDLPLDFIQWIIALDNGAYCSYDEIKAMYVSFTQQNSGI